MKPKLVDNWRQSVNWFSVQAQALSALAGVSWLAVPEDLRAAVPPEWMAKAAIVLAALGILGRLIDQGGGDA